MILLFAMGAQCARTCVDVSTELDKFIVSTHGDVYICDIICVFLLRVLRNKVSPLCDTRPC